jgi:hypothetical protein
MRSLSKRHPVPTSANHLHIKLRAGTSAGNVVAPNNWLLDRGRLNAGVAAWHDEKEDQSNQAF